MKKVNEASQLAGVILNGLGKDAAQIISRINGFTHVETVFDYATGKVSIVKETKYGSNPDRLAVRCYGWLDMYVVVIMIMEAVFGLI